MQQCTANWVCSAEYTGQITKSPTISKISKITKISQAKRAHAAPFGKLGLQRRINRSHAHQIDAAGAETANAGSVRGRGDGKEAVVALVAVAVGEGDVGQATGGVHTEGRRGEERRSRGYREAEGTRNTQSKHEEGGHTWSAH